MKKYCVMKVECPKKQKVTDLVEQIRNSVAYEKIFFEVSDYRGNHNGLLSLLPFSHEVLVDGVTPRKMIVLSNLDENWIWPNYDHSESLSDVQVLSLAETADRIGIKNCSGIMLGFDQIAWGAGLIRPGTYGYQKSCSYDEAGANYLSNAVTISKNMSKNTVTCVVCCEDRFRQSELLCKLLPSLGRVKSERALYAPENESERLSWEMKYKTAEKNYKSTMDDLAHVYTNIPYPQNERNKEIDIYSQMQNERANPLNTRRIASDMFMEHGWDKAKSDISGIAFEKKLSEDSRLLVSVDSRHHGHLLYTFLSYESPFFSFTENMRLFHFHEPATEEESACYFYNLLYALEQVEKSLY